MVCMHHDLAIPLGKWLPLRMKVSDMNVTDYKYFIAQMLRRDDVLASGKMHVLAAKCVLYCSESCTSDASVIQAVERLEAAAGIIVDEEGEYIKE